MINKDKLLRHIEKEFNVKVQAEEILYYVCFDWRNDPALEMIEVYINEKPLRLNNDMITGFDEFIIVYSDNEIYLLSNKLERKV